MHPTPPEPEPSSRLPLLARLRRFVAGLFLDPSAGSARASGRTADAGAPVDSPEHVAIIMDGNGRWARRRQLPRQAGHRQGARRLHDVTAAAARRGIRYLTVYAFSTENWSRPDDEVRALMSLFVEFFHAYDTRLREADVRLRFTGDRSALPPDVCTTWLEAEAGSRARTGLQLIIAFNYGGRHELVQCARQLAREAVEGRLDPEAIDESDIQRTLYLPDVPDPDLVIRTSGEKRLSNFLIWEAAYAEFHDTPVLWPDFDEAALDAAIEAYRQRDRRFGALGTADSSAAGIAEAAGG